MARIIDSTKLERIKKATMDLVVKYGYRGASIERIAKKAGVSAGYLYRHYDGKDDLLDDLIESNLQKVEDIFYKTLREENAAEGIIYGCVRILFDIALNNPILAKFLSTLMFDQSCEVIEKREEDDMEAKELTSKILEIGIKNGEINPKTTSKEVELVLMTIIFSYISSNLNKGHDREMFGEKQAKRITEICINALK